MTGGPSSRDTNALNVVSRATARYARRRSLDLLAQHRGDGNGSLRGLGVVAVLLLGCADVDRVASRFQRPRISTSPLSCK